MWGSVSFWLLISLIRDFTAPRRATTPSRLSLLWTGCHRLALSLRCFLKWEWKTWGDHAAPSLGRRGKGARKEKEQVKWKWQSANIPAGSCGCILHPLRGHRGAPPSRPPAPRHTHLPLAALAFTDSQIIYGRVRGRGSPSMRSWENPLCVKKPSFLRLLSNTVLWDNIEHYEVWGIFHGTL